jgi:ribosomal protein L11 methyltransferase
MAFLEIRLSPLSSDEAKSRLMAELLEKGFESFAEYENGLLAYIDSDVFHEVILKDIPFLQDHPGVRAEIKRLEDRNWNKEWESNYPPVILAGKCHVRAPFHPCLPEIPVEITIEPKMSFGTAHHETTRLMAEWLLDLDLFGKDVLDMGCGTGILAILANKLGARSVIAIDNDVWAWRNCAENFTNNGMRAENALLGDARLIRKGTYDLVMANINRNILLQDMNAYCNGLRDHGLLLLSGFYQKDSDAVAAAAVTCGLIPGGSRTLNDWTVLMLLK